MFAVRCMFGPETVVKTRSGKEVERPRPAALLPRHDGLPLPPDRLPEPPPRPDDIGLDWIESLCCWMLVYHGRLALRELR